jgi:putative addiction module component (TIGR02574 family)
MLRSVRDQNFAVIARVRGIGYVLDFHWFRGTIQIMSTAASISLDGLSVTDKIVLMERLWDDLSRRPSDVASPDWHADILDKRRNAVREGRTAFVDWEDAKRRLRERLQ